MKLTGLKNWSSTRLLAVGFTILILFGTILLELPVSTRGNTGLSFMDALFTATSATCVTGLSLFDTYTNFTLFGQIVILFLIQIGGLGFITVAMLFSLATHRRIGLRMRSWLADGIGSLQLTGIVRMVRRVLLGTALFEGAGTMLLSIRFVPEFGFRKGLWFSLFHSVSAFCNAGFDLMGTIEPSSSLTGFYDDPLVILTISALIILGGIGFIVWTDIVDCKYQIKKLNYHSKVVMTFTAVLLVAGTVLFYFSERKASMSGMDRGERILSSFFQSVTPRTAGFNSINLSSLSSAGQILTMILMFIGAAPGGTGGGVKITTFLVALASMYASHKKKNDTVIGQFRIDDDTIRGAFCSITTYISITAVGVFILCTQGIDVSKSIFECLSAIGTVGLSSVDAHYLNSITKFVIIVLMYTGRVGSLTVFLALSSKENNNGLRKPVGKLLVG